MTLSRSLPSSGKAAVAALVVLALVAVGHWAAPAMPVFKHSAALAAPQSYYPMAPVRLLDTRTTTSIQGGTSITLQVTGTNGIPSGAGAVVLNVTAVNPSTAGFISVYPAGTTKPNASNLNFTAGQVVPNLVIAQLSTGGAVSIFSNTTTDVIVDVAGFFAVIGVVGASGP